MKNHEHALIALLWSSLDPESGEPLDSAEFRPSLELQNRVAADWQRFRDAAEAMGFDAEEHCARMLHPDNPDPQRARNRSLGLWAVGETMGRSTHRPLRAVR
jgi:hypothetical protein